MKTLVLTGTKSQIVQGLARIAGEVREAIETHKVPREGEDIFDKMQPATSCSDRLPFRRVRRLFAKLAALVCSGTCVAPHSRA